MAPKKAAQKRKNVPTKWTQEKETELIELWKARSFLYDISSEKYHDRDSKEKALQEMASALDVSGETLSHVVYIFI